MQNPSDDAKAGDRGLGERHSPDSPEAPALARMYTCLDEIHHLRAIQTLLDWDQKVFLPPAAGSERGRQIEYITGLLHSRQTAPALLDSVDRLFDSRDQLNPDDRVNVEGTKYELDRQRKLPTEFVAEQARLAAETELVWEKAKHANDFGAVQPFLEKIIEMAQREAEYVGYDDHPYDALLDKYERGARIAVIKPLLLSLAGNLAQMIPAISASFGESPPLKGPYPADAQNRLGRKVVEDMGYDFSRGRLDTTEHPFMCSLGRDDYRITTAYYTESYLPALFSTIHEAGHGMYEQGLCREEAGRPLGEPISLGIHESQSRLWENLIARSRPFAEYLHRLLAEYLPDDYRATTPDTLWRQLNRVRPSFIRIEADEVTYSQHVVIRTLLEEALISGDLQVRDLPARWNELYEQYLGITPPTDRQGVLQDVHWYNGLIGYFPTYVLGNLYGAAMLTKIRTDIPDLDTGITRGDFAPLLEWLRRKVHRHGRRYRAEELIEQITGRPLSIDPFLGYLRDKFGV